MNRNAYNNEFRANMDKFMQANDFLNQIAFLNITIKIINQIKHKLFDKFATVNVEIY